jgi:hypothetical protein
VACLIAAIKQANIQPGPRHEIRLAAGTYTLTKEDNTTDGLNGLPSITTTLTIRGAGTEATIIERQEFSEVPFRLIHVSPTGSLTLERLTLQGGAPDGWGGGLFNDRGTVTIRESALIGNVASGPLFAAGGGLFNKGGIVVLVHSTMISNTHNGGEGSGGGLYNDEGTVTILNSTIASNSARGADGGSGGGIANPNQSGTVTILNSAIADNVAQGTGGGILNGGTLTLINSTVAGNSAGPFGNQCGGGGLANGGTVTILNSTIATNSAPTGCTFLFGGGGLFNRATATLQNTILAHNTSGESDVIGESAPDCLGSVTSLGHNVLGDTAGCDIDLQEGTDLTGDAGLAEFTDDGTPGHGHFPLLHDSPAIDAGDDAACPPLDQLGQPRVRICDIGAVEFQGMALSSQ